jgi:hypothetical protein
MKETGNSPFIAPALAGDSIGAVPERVCFDAALVVSFSIGVNLVTKSSGVARHQRNSLRFVNHRLYRQHAG